MISILNYGLGNLQAFANIYKRLNIRANIVSNSEELKKSSRIILPGVGAFDWAMKRLNDSGMRETLDDLVLNKGKPILGICVGMQMMARKSQEGIMEGLGWVEGEIVKFEQDKSNQKLHLPHMGWNDVNPLNCKSIFKDLDGDSRFYFLHSYYFLPQSQYNILSKTEYGIEFTSSINKENVFGVQFHPEKSHKWGMQLLKNFAEIELC